MSLFGAKNSSAQPPAPDAPLILVVDDEVDLCRILKVALEHQGWRVEIAHDGAEGLEKARSHPPALILLDIKMPKLNGYQALAQLQQDPALAHTPVIMISSIDEASKHAPEEWMRKLEVRGYLAKPFECEEAVRQIREALGAR